MSEQADTPPYRYNAGMAERIELAWQDRWADEGTFHTPNPVGELSDGFDRVAGRPKLYVNDMFPYPSGAGLHVGHPLGFIGTDVFARYQRMNGHNVLHAMGFDAFGLPAEQYAVETGQHPRVTTEANILNYSRQLRRLGLGHDPRRSVATADVSFYRWTQWIFLQIFNSWYDVDAARARPVAELGAELDSGERVPAEGTNPFGRMWAQLSTVERREVVNNHRLAYISEAPVNWCPGLGTVLANEEVTADGRSDRGNFPVYRRPLKQWKMRITAYAERLLADLDRLDWSESIKLMQRNWIGRSVGASIVFPAGEGIEVFTTRPDTLFGATYMVLAPEHPLVAPLIPDSWPADVPDSWTGGFGTPSEAVASYQKQAAQRSEMDRQAEARTKTGVFTGSWARNPATGEQIPVFIADYVLTGYGTGAIMAVPGQDQRDWDFAAAFDLPIVRTVQPPEGFDGQAYTGEGPAIHSTNDELSLEGMDIVEAKAATIRWLELCGFGHGTVTYRLRDWLFSRQRYWGEPFPIVYGADGLPQPLPESMLPVELPDMEDFTPKTSDDENSDPEPPLGRATEWATVRLDLGEGEQTYRRELNTMPQWAGSCWYELRYLDPTNEQSFVDPEVERYWMGKDPSRPVDTGGVDLYVGGVEHAVLHLLYARFWHKVLFDLGHVNSEEPFRRLFNQGYVLAYAYTDERGRYVDAAKVELHEGRYFLGTEEVWRENGKMGKSLKNSVTPDEMYADYGADTLRLYEMFTGPMDQSRPWETKAVVGSMRLLQRIWRVVVDEYTGALRTSSGPVPEQTLRVLHRTIAAVRDGMQTLRFNIAIAKITELTNHLTTAYAGGGVPTAVAEPLVLMLAPLAPHVAEELWSRLGHPESLTWEAFPTADPAYLVEETIEIPVQVNGKVRGTVTVSSQADAAAMEAAARGDAKIAAHLEAGTLRKVVAVPGRLVNFVLG